MDIQYKIRYKRRFYRDLSIIELRINTNRYKKLKDEIDIKIENLQFMPRIHKTLDYKKDPLGEYRRIVIEKYSIIYKIKDNEIMILRIFNQKENYLNSKSFILKEEFQKYVISKRRKIKMIKFKKLKNSYLRLKENFTRIINGEEVWSRRMDKLIEEAEESLKTEGYITLEELREELIKEYNVNI